MLSYPIREFFLYIAVSAADADAVNPNDIKTFSANISTFFIRREPYFSNGLRSLARNPLDCNYFRQLSY